MQQEVSELNQLEGVFVAASRAMVAIAAKSFASVENQVTLNQYRVLIILLSEGSAPPSVLSKRMGLKPYIITRLCDHLLQNRLIVRKSSELDRRKIELSVTPQGKKLVSKVINSRRKILKELAEFIPMDKRSSVSDAFRYFTEISSNVFEEKFLNLWVL